MSGVPLLSSGQASGVSLRALPYVHGDCHYTHIYSPNNGSIEKNKYKIKKYTIIKSESKNRQYAF